MLSKDSALSDLKKVIHPGNPILMFFFKVLLFRYNMQIYNCLNNI